MPSADIKLTGGDKYKDVLAKIANQHVGLRVGILSNATNDQTGKPVAPYAAAMEFGAHINRNGHEIIIPPRPFMRQAANRHSKEWFDWLANAMSGNPDKARDAMNLLGAKIRGGISEEIGRGNFTPLAEGTVESKRRKGNADPEHPLVDSGSMRASLSYEVVDT